MKGGRTHHCTRCGRHGRGMTELRKKNGRPWNLCKKCLRECEAKSGGPLPRA